MECSDVPTHCGKHAAVSLSCRFSVLIEIVKYNFLNYLQTFELCFVTVIQLNGEI